MRKLSVLFVWFVSVFCAGGFATSVAHAGVPRLSEVAPGVWRSGQPEAASDFAALAQMGIKRVIDLQWWEDQYTEEKSWAQAAHLIDLHYPMGGEYPDEQKVGEILAMMKNGDKEPILIHCKAGEDRTGLVVALYRVHVQGWSTDKARDEMLAQGYHWYYAPLEAYWQMHSTKGSQFIPTSGHAVVRR